VPGNDGACGQLTRRASYREKFVPAGRSHNGNVQAKRGVEIHAGARVRGDLETGSLVIEKAAFFQGASRMDARSAA
jgi:cytoskeletal protein CcmA (bactofilin family)